MATIDTIINNIFLKQPRRGKTHEVQLTPYKAAGHRIVTIILLSVIFATSCDPGYNEDMVIRNESSHTVTVIPSPYSWYNTDMDSTFSQENKTYTLAPNEEVVIQSNGGIGSASLEEGIATFQQYYGDSVTIRFPEVEIEPAPQEIYHITDTTGISPYNFGSTYYKYEEKIHYGRWFNGHSTYGKLTFSITDEHYDAAWGW